jgi:hypothetical protein
VKKIVFLEYFPQIKSFLRILEVGGVGEFTYGS